MGSAAIAADASGRWFLMSREGECAPIATLQRRIPDLAGVDSPDTFMALMKKKGYAATSTAMRTRGGTVYEVAVPDQGLALVFVPAGLCPPATRR